MDSCAPSLGSVRFSCSMAILTGIPTPAGEPGGTVNRVVSRHALLDPGPGSRRRRRRPRPRSRTELLHQPGKPAGARFRVQFAIVEKNGESRPPKDPGERQAVEDLHTSYQADG